MSAPWRELGPRRFSPTAQQLDDGGYIALGKLRSLGELPVEGGVVSLTRVEGAARATDDDLRAWVQAAAARTAQFLRGLPMGHAWVLVAPVDGDECGIFGTVLRKGTASAVLFFGAQADPAGFRTDWMATHELFHLTNPRVTKRIRWFLEGAATYYQTVLRARAGAWEAGTAWGDLADGFAKHCQPLAGKSLRWESEHLNETHRYTRVYWGAACLLFRVDVAARQRGTSLDAVIRELHARSQQEPLDEDEVVAALDRAAGSRLASEHLDATRSIDLAPLLQQLGVEPTGPESAKLLGGAPLAKIRDAIVASERPGSSGTRR